jgi:hypothetical protein
MQAEGFERGRARAMLPKTNFFNRWHGRDRYNIEVRELRVAMWMMAGEVAVVRERH